MKTNRRAIYYTPPGSYNGLVKINGNWRKVNGLNRIDKDGWTRWQGPPSIIMEDILNHADFTYAVLLFPRRAILAACSHTIKGM